MNCRATQLKFVCLRMPHLISIISASQLHFLTRLVAVSKIHKHIIGEHVALLSGLTVIRYTVLVLVK